MRVVLWIVHTVRFLVVVLVLICDDPCLSLGREVGEKLGLVDMRQRLVGATRVSVGVLVFRTKLPFVIPERIT